VRAEPTDSSCSRTSHVATPSVSARPKPARQEWTVCSPRAHCATSASAARVLAGVLPLMPRDLKQTQWTGKGSYIFSEKSARTDCNGECWHSVSGAWRHSRRPSTTKSSSRPGSRVAIARMAASADARPAVHTARHAVSGHWALKAPRQEAGRARGPWAMGSWALIDNVQLGTDRQWAVGH
jgi:hypothetical protein